LLVLLLVLLLLLVLAVVGEAAEGLPVLERRRIVAFALLWQDWLGGHKFTSTESFSLSSCSCLCVFVVCGVGVRGSVHVVFVGCRRCLNGNKQRRRPSILSLTIQPYLHQPHSSTSTSTTIKRLL